MASPENDSNDFYDLRKLSPNLRHEMLQIEKRVVAENRRGQADYRSPLERAKIYGRRHKKDIAMSTGTVALLAAIGGVMWQANATSDAHNKRLREQVVREVLTHPTQLQILGVCPDDLKLEAKHLPAALAAQYLTAASQESALATPCDVSNVASITIYLPNAGESVVTASDIIQSVY